MLNEINNLFSESLNKKEENILFWRDSFKLNKKTSMDFLLKFAEKTNGKSVNNADKASINFCKYSLLLSTKVERNAFIETLDEFTEDNVNARCSQSLRAAMSYCGIRDHCLLGYVSNRNDVKLRDVGHNFCVNGYFETSPVTRLLLDLNKEPSNPPFSLVYLEKIKEDDDLKYCLKDKNNIFNALHTIDNQIDDAYLYNNRLINKFLIMNMVRNKEFFKKLHYLPDNDKIINKTDIMLNRYLHIANKPDYDI